MYVIEFQQMCCKDPICIICIIHHTLCLPSILIKLSWNMITNISNRTMYCSRQIYLHMSEKFRLVVRTDGNKKHMLCVRVREALLLASDRVISISVRMMRSVRYIAPNKSHVLSWVKTIDFPIDEYVIFTLKLIILYFEISEHANVVILFESALRLEA